MNKQIKGNIYYIIINILYIIAYIIYMNDMTNGIEELKRWLWLNGWIQ